MVSQTVRYKYVTPYKAKKPLTFREKHKLVAMDENSFNYDDESYLILTLTMVSS